MSTKMRLAAWVLGGAATVCLAGTVQAQQLVYDANTDMVAQVTGASSNVPTYGQWSWGYRATNDGVASTNFTAFTTENYHDYTSMRGWQTPGGASYALVNHTSSGVPYGGHTLQPGQIVLVANGILLTQRWTAPRSGRVNIAATFSQMFSGGAMDVHLVQVHEGVVTSLYDGVIGGATTNLIASLPFIVVSAGDNIDMVTGDAGNPFDGDSTGLYIAITYQQMLNIYNANTDMVAQVTGASSNVSMYGQWSWGYRSTNDGVTATNFTPFTTAEYFNDAKWRGWNNSTYALVNYSGVAQQLVAGFPLVQPGQMHGAPGTLARLMVLRWVAPDNVTISIATTFSQLYSGDVDVHLVHIHEGVGTSLYDGLIGGATTNLAARPSPCKVSIGDYIDVVAGASTSINGDWIGLYHSISQYFPAGVVFSFR